MRLFYFLAILPLLLSSCVLFNSVSLKNKPVKSILWLYDTTQLVIPGHEIESGLVILLKDDKEVLYSNGLLNGKIGWHNFDVSCINCYFTEGKIIIPKHLDPKEYSSVYVRAQSKHHPDISAELVLEMNHLVDLQLYASNNYEAAPAGIVAVEVIATYDNGMQINSIDFPNCPDKFENLKVYTNGADYRKNNLYINSNPITITDHQVSMTVSSLSYPEVSDTYTILLKAMAEVERKDFVPKEHWEKAYDDGPLPIGKNQTISQPYIVAYMAQELHLSAEERVLEIGTGCGYNAAVLSRIVDHVYSIEIIEWLAGLARENLAKTAYSNITTRHGDGYEGWPEMAPFDAIILTAAPAKVPEPLKNQLKKGGRLLAPVGRESQDLILYEKQENDIFRHKKLHPVRFVPMTGIASEY